MASRLVELWRDRGALRVYLGESDDGFGLDEARALHGELGELLARVDADRVRHVEQ